MKRRDFLKAAFVAPSVMVVDFGGKSSEIPPATLGWGNNVVAAKVFSADLARYTKREVK